MYKEHRCLSSVFFISIFYFFVNNKLLKLRKKTKSQQKYMIILKDLFAKAILAEKPRFFDKVQFYTA